jgi:hypothetical protein
VWVTDITYVATDEGWLYLAGVKDLYSCEIVGYAVDEHMTQQHTGQALFAAYKKHRPPRGLIHHNDRLNSPLDALRNLASSELWVTEASAALQPFMPRRTGHWPLSRCDSSRD